MTLNPRRARPGDIVTITGAAFGSGRGTLTFGSHQTSDADILTWTDSIIKAQVPADARPGQVPVIITKDDGNQISTPPASFTVLD